MLTFRLPLILKTSRGSVQDIHNGIGSMYASVLFLGMKYAAMVQPVVSVERTVFYRERAAGMYSSMPYAFAQVIYNSKLLN